MNLVLKIFVAEDCPSCLEARVIAGRIAQDYPDHIVEVIDISDNRAVVPDTVFATPTYMLGNRIVSLGNPRPDEIVRWFQQAIVPPA
jgi:thiol-disulfide isomerase/thioredoxin